MPYATTRKHFERLVEEALGMIPERYRSLFRNIAVIVEDYPDEAVVRETGIPREELMGLFSGQPYGRNDEFFSLPQQSPDVITLYQKNIEAETESEEGLIHEIRMTILHEVGHYFGLDEDELEEIEDE